MAVLDQNLITTKTRYLTVDEVAQILRVSTSTVHRLIKNGTLPAVRLNRCRRVADSVLAAVMQASLSSSH